MTDRSPRRSFLTCALLSTGGTTLLAGRATADEGQNAQKGAVQEAVAECRRSSQEREMASRARYFERLVERFGPGILDEVKAVTIEGARRDMEKAELEDRGLGAVKSQLWDHLGPEFEYEVLEDTEEDLRFRVTKCPLADGMRRHEAGDIGFAFHCAWDYGFCEGLNPRIEFSRTKTLMVGDDHCDHAYRLKS